MDKNFEIFLRGLLGISKDYLERVGYILYKERNVGDFDFIYFLIPPGEVEKEDLLYVITNFPVLVYEIHYPVNRGTVFDREVLESILNKKELLRINGDIKAVMRALNIMEKDFRGEYFTNFSVGIERDDFEKFLNDWHVREKVTKVLKSIIKKRRGK